MPNCARQAGRPIPQTSNSPMALARKLARNMAIAEWPTAEDETGKPGFADYGVLFAGLVPVGIIETKKGNIDVAGQASRGLPLQQIFRYGASQGRSWIAAATDAQAHDQVTEMHASYLPVAWAW